MSRVIVSPNVQPIYEHIASADYPQLKRIEKVLTGRITSTDISGVDQHERNLLLKAVELRRRELKVMADTVSKEISSAIANRFMEARP